MESEHSEDEDDDEQHSDDDESDGGAKPKKRAKRRKKMTERNPKVRNFLKSKQTFFAHMHFRHTIDFAHSFPKEPEGLDEFVRELNAHFEEVENFQMIVE